MKKILPVVFALCTIFIISCVKENQPHQLFLGATLNNQAWIAEPSTNYFANKDSLQVQGTNTSTGSNVIFNIRFSGVGNYSFTKGQASFYLKAGPGEGPIALYNLDSTQTNTATISSYNIQTNIATGKFQLHFISPNGNSTISLTSGSFWIELPPSN